MGGSVYKSFTFIIDEAITYTPIVMNATSKDDTACEHVDTPDHTVVLPISLQTFPSSHSVGITDDVYDCATILVGMSHGFPDVSQFDFPGTTHSPTATHCRDSLDDSNCKYAGGSDVSIVELINNRINEIKDIGVALSENVDTFGINTLKVCRLLVTLVRDDLGIDVEDKRPGSIRCKLYPALYELSIPNVMDNIDAIDYVVQKCYNLNLTSAYRLGRVIEYAENEVNPDVRGKVQLYIESMYGEDLRMLISKRFTTEEKYANIRRKALSPSGVKHRRTRQPYCKKRTRDGSMIASVHE